MAFFEYQTLWIVYISALAILGLSGYLIIKPIPYRWIKWNVLVAVMVFLAAPIQTNENWMIPSILYFLFEYYFIKNTESIQVLHQLLMHVGIGIAATSCMLVGINLFSKDPLQK